MQTDLFTADHAPMPDVSQEKSTDAPTVRTLGERLLQHCTRMATGGSADDRALQLDYALRLAVPHVERIAALGIVSWPDDAVQMDDLAQALLCELAAALPFAPRTTAEALMAWLSNTLLRALYHLRQSAKRDRARRQRAERAAGGRFLDDMGARRPAHAGVASDSGHDLPDVELSAEFAQARLTTVLNVMPTHDARLLRMRAEGWSWRQMGGLLRTSPRTARRRHAEAVRRAQRIALASGTGAPAQSNGDSHDHAA